jgi:hypothetical protein
MALIKCPECGKEISSEAKLCPNCAYPIADASPEGIIKIKLCAVQASTGFNGNQSVTISKYGEELWNGEVGEIAEIELDKKTEIYIKYHMSAMHYGGSCSGFIDPSKGKKYCVQARQGIFKTIITLQKVDVFDSE